MRIVHLAAGAGEMYCGACARDISLIRGLISRGHDVQVLPLYTPLRTESELPVEPGPVFLGGVNAYLQQRFALFRGLPRALDRFLNSPGLLRLASRVALSTSASQLGDLTVSVLAGRDGRQRKELEDLVQYLGRQGPPDVFVLTNALLSGLAPPLKESFDVPILCGLQGEDGFIAATGEPHASRARELIRQNLTRVDRLIAPGKWYVRELGRGFVDPQKVRIVRTGLDAAAFSRPGPRPRDPFILGYLSVITPLKGLDLLVHAWRSLVEQGRDVRLRVAGRVLNRGYWRDIQSAVDQPGLAERFEYLGEVDFEQKVRFLHQCSLLALPSRAIEARGLVVLEALAAGVPVIAPAAGAPREIVNKSGGGMLVPPGDVAALAQAVARVMDDPEQADWMGAQGAHTVATEHRIEQAVEEFLAVCTEVVR